LKSNLNAPSHFTNVEYWRLTPEKNPDITSRGPHRSRNYWRSAGATGGTIQGPVKERWKLLCEEAVNEQDPNRLLELIREINDLLAAKQNRLNTAHQNKTDDEPDK
jgi:hypothetical protein